MRQLPVVRFHLAGQAFAVEAAQVAGMVAEPEQGIHVADLLGLARQESAPLRWLSIHRGDARPVALAVEEPVRLAPLPAEQIHPLPPLLAARHCLPGLRAIALEQDGLTLLLDLQGAYAKRITENNIEAEIQP